MGTLTCSCKLGKILRIWQATKPAESTIRMTAMCFSSYDENDEVEITFKVATGCLVWSRTWLGLLGFGMLHSLSYQGSSVPTVAAKLPANSKNLSQPNLGLQLHTRHPIQGRLKKFRLSLAHVPSVQSSAKVDAPGCVNAAGKLGRSDKLQQ